MARKVELTCARERVCTCGETIGVGDCYTKVSTPAWLSGTGHWEVITTCHACNGSL